MLLKHEAICYKQHRIILEEKIRQKKLKTLKIRLSYNNNHNLVLIILTSRYISVTIFHYLLSQFSLPHHFHIPHLCEIFTQM